MPYVALGGARIAGGKKEATPWPGRSRPVGVRVRGRDRRGERGAFFGKRYRVDSVAAFEVPGHQDRTSVGRPRGRAELKPVPGDCGDEYRKPPFLTASGDLSHHLEAFPSPYVAESGPGGRSYALSGTKWEEIAGFARAVRVGKRILVSGTTATHGPRLIGGSDPASQAVFCLDKIEGALQSLGASLEDVVRTRIYVSDAAVWEPVARAHGARFGETRPANTLIRADLVGDGYLVEMEAEAVIRPEVRDRSTTPSD